MKHPTLEYLDLDKEFLIVNHFCNLSIHRSLISQIVSDLVLEKLLELETLYCAVAEAALLSGEELSGLEGQEAVLGAFGESGGRGVEDELILHVLRNHLQVVLSLHYVLDY